MRRQQLNGVARRTARDRLPWWAAPGPRYIDHTGDPTGDISGWPAIQGLEPPAYTNALRVSRPGPSELKRRYEAALRWPGGDKRRAAIRADYRQEVRDLVSRIRAQRSEEAAVGLPALEAEDDELTGRLIGVLCAIRGLAGRDPTNPMVMAAWLMANVFWNRDSDCPLSGWDTDVLATLLPSLTGVIRDDAEEIVRSPGTPAGDLAFWTPQVPAPALAA
jgi:hypothetical protein